MRATVCPRCGTALPTTRPASRCAACRADWHHQGFPDHCPGCDAKTDPLATSCTACGQTMDALAGEIVELRANLRARYRRRRWLTRIAVAGVIGAAAALRALGVL